MLELINFIVEKLNETIIITDDIFLLPILKITRRWESSLKYFVVLFFSGFFFVFFTLVVNHIYNKKFNMFLFFLKKNLIKFLFLIFIVSFFFTCLHFFFFFKEDYLDMFDDDDDDGNDNDDDHFFSDFKSLNKSNNGNFISDKIKNLNQSNLNINEDLFDLETSWHYMTYFYSWKIQRASLWSIKFYYLLHKFFLLNFNSLIDTKCFSFFYIILYKFYLSKLNINISFNEIFNLMRTYNLSFDYSWIRSPINLIDRSILDNAYNNINYDYSYLFNTYIHERRLQADSNIIIVNLNHINNYNSFLMFGNITFLFITSLSLISYLNSGCG